MDQELAVHPDAAIFPMMDADELATLAADIKENGLKEPIVLGQYEGNEVLVDGRNRHAACILAEVEPTFHTLNGEDVKAFIVSSNINRRHLNAGQRAMAYAMMYPKPADASQNAKKDKTGLVTKPVSEGVNKTSLSQARTVLGESRARAEQVMSGEVFLDVAYVAAKAALKEKQTTEDQRVILQAGAPDLLALVHESRISLDDGLAKLKTRKEDQAKLALIKDDSPDLVDLVDEGRMSVQDALAAHEKRGEEDRNQRTAATALVADVFRLFNARHSTPAAAAKTLMEKFDPTLWPSSELGEASTELFQSSADMLLACAKIRKQQEKRS
jgi:ParB-like nuclease domain